MTAIKKRTEEDMIAEFAREDADLTQMQAQATEDWTAERISATQLLERLQAIKDLAGERWNDLHGTADHEPRRLIALDGEMGGDV